jgi:hypothetical protein
MLFFSYTQYFIHPSTFACHQQLEGLRHHRPHLSRSNGSRGSCIFDPASVTATARRSPISSTLPPSQQWLSSYIIKSASAAATTRGAPTSSTPPPPLPRPQQFCLRYIDGSRSCATTFGIINSSVMSSTSSKSPSTMH